MRTYKYVLMSFEPNYMKSTVIQSVSQKSFTMTSLPPGECCTTGIKHQGTPKGTIEKIGNSEF